MSEHRPGEMAGLAAAGLAVCCGLPLLLSAGAVGSTVGIAAGSILIAAVGLVVGVLGRLRWRHRRAGPTEQAPEHATAASGGG